MAEAGVFRKIYQHPLCEAKYNAVAHQCCLNRFIQAAND
jgi:hypothetical protein